MEFANASFDDDTVQKKINFEFVQFLQEHSSLLLNSFSAFWNIVTGINVRFFLNWSITIFIQ